MKKTVDIDQKIIKRAIKGHRSSQKALYEKYSSAMFNVCMRMMRNREEAEDVLQESFVDAFRRLESFRFESTFGAWLKRIMVNHCINAIKKKKPDLEYHDEIASTEATDYGSHDHEGIDYTVKQVVEAAKTLSVASKTVFNLYLFEGYDHTEIAQILGVSESTSKTHYMNARRKIKAHITSNWINYEGRKN